MSANGWPLLPRCAVLGCDEDGLWWSGADGVWFCEPCAIANMPGVRCECCRDSLCACGSQRFTDSIPGPGAATGPKRDAGAAGDLAGPEIEEMGSA